MKILLYGSKDFGRLIKCLVAHCGYEFSGFIDDFSTGENILGSYSEIRKRYPPSEYGIVIAAGYKNIPARWSLYQKVLSDGYEVPTLIHKNAFIHENAKIGRGSIIMVGAIVDAFSKVGELNVLWPGAILNHDSTTGENTLLCPHSTVSGFATIGHNCFIGAGAIIVDHREVPDSSFIKAGKVYS